MEYIQVTLRIFDLYNGGLFIPLIPEHLLCSILCDRQVKEVSNTLGRFCSNEGCVENNIIKSVQKMGHYFTYLQQKIILFFAVNITFNYVPLNFPSLPRTHFSQIP